MRSIRFAASLAALLLVTAPIIGCGAQRTHTTTTITTEEPAEGPQKDAPSKTVRRATTETREEAPDEGLPCGGLLSRSQQGIGWVLALPLRLAGAAINGIF